MRAMPPSSLWSERRTLSGSEEVRQERRSGERPALFCCSPSSRIPRSHGAGSVPWRQVRSGCRKHVLHASHCRLLAHAGEIFGEAASKILVALTAETGLVAQLADHV